MISSAKTEVPYDWLARRIASSFWIPSLEAEDVIQEARIALLRAQANWREGTGDLEHYCARTIKNHLLNLRRGIMQPSRYTPEPLLQLLDFDTVPIDDELAEGLDFRLRLRRIAGRMKTLPTNQRQAIELVMNGASYEEVCEALELSRPAVKSLVVRARRALAAV